MNNSNNLIVIGKNSNINFMQIIVLLELKHKDEIDKTSTTKLNRMFKIKDHNKLEI